MGYRLLTLLQMAGVLVLAAGVPAMFDEGDFRAATVGNVLMRIALVVQWLRAAWSDPAGRVTAHRYAAGVAVLQVCWLARLALPEGLALAGFLVLIAAELSVPWWAEHVSATHWHPHHIAERYGLFTIIVLGESVLAATTAAESAVSEAGLSVELVLGGSAASGSSSVTAEAVSHKIEASETLVVLAVAVPVALFLLVVWALHAPLGGAPAHGTARMLPAVVAVLAVVALVEVGLPLGWATLLLCLPPAALVAEHHWPRAEVTAGRARAS